MDSTVDANVCENQEFLIKLSPIKFTYEDISLFDTSGNRDVFSMQFIRRQKRMEIYLHSTIDDRVQPSPAGLNTSFRRQF